jgi:hypothetical protein
VYLSYRLQLDILVILTAPLLQLFAEDSSNLKIVLECVMVEENVLRRNANAKVDTLERTAHL